MIQRVHQHRTKLLLVAVSCAGILFALLTLGGALNAGSAADAKSGSFGGDVATAIVGAALLSSTIAWAVHIERRLRAQHEPVNAPLDLAQFSAPRNDLGPQHHKTLRWIAVALPLVIAVVFGIEGIQGIRSVRHDQFLLTPVAGGITTIGRISSYQTSCFRGCTYKPTIAFKDTIGTTHTFATPFQVDQPTVGQEVSVSFDPKHPSIAHDTSEGPDSWDFPLYTMYFATFVASLSFLMFLFAIRAIASSTQRAAVK